MRIQFEPGLEHQTAATDSVIDSLAGAVGPAAGLQVLSLGGSAVACATNPAIDHITLLEHLREVQARSGLPQSPDLGEIRGSISRQDGQCDVEVPSLAVDMETGTGKTYVYIRTAIELRRRFGLTKFIVLVPTVAVREGVLKTFETTREHFRKEYPDVPFHAVAYSSQDLNEVFHFAGSPQLEFLVMTLDSVNKDSNVLRNLQERTRYLVPLHVLQATRPVLILDEPQNMDTPLAQETLLSFDPVLMLRYSATHKGGYPTVHRLTPAEAYQRGLVKRIEVLSVTNEQPGAGAFARLEEIRVRAGKATARVALHKAMKNGLAEKVVTVKLGESLEEKSGDRPQYAGWILRRVDPATGTAHFANGVDLSTGAAVGADADAAMRQQVRATVKEHLRRQQMLLDEGVPVKVLSLIFIPTVADYTAPDGKVRTWLIEAYEEFAPKFQHFADLNVRDVHGGYFAKKKAKNGEVTFLDSKAGSDNDADEAVYRLIMRDKERLLSFESSLSFIVSHSALREGWDSPNVTQVCTLAHAKSPTRKRQEIGRGVRLLVDTAGSRITDPRHNVLTVIANESYHAFARELQSEWREQGGEGDIPVRPPRPTVQVRRRPEVFDSAAFKTLWAAISRRTTYTVSIDKPLLIAQASQLIADNDVTPPALLISRAQLSTEEGDSTVVKAVQTDAAERVELPGGGRVEMLIDEVQAGLGRHTPSLFLTRRTIAEVILASGKLEQAARAPEAFASLVTSILVSKLPEVMALNIRYTASGDSIPLDVLVEAFNATADQAEPSIKGRALYDHTVCESGPERSMHALLEESRQVEAYLKLPRLFTVPTPLGTYNPDWAIAVRAGAERTVHLVRETKSVPTTVPLRPSEQAKVRCGRLHFDALGVEYRQATGVPGDLAVADHR